MPITRSTLKKLQQEQQKQQEQQEQQEQQKQQNGTCKYAVYYPRVRFNLDTNIHKIDFVDASIEWRKNKLKKENCCFEYI